MIWELIALSLVVLNDPFPPNSPVMVEPVRKVLGVYQDKTSCEKMKAVARSVKPKYVKVKCVEKF